MTRRILLAVSAVLLFIFIVGSALTFTFAWNGPFHPGHRLFPAQLTSEDFWRMRLIQGSQRRAVSALDLLERRVDDLEGAQDSQWELLALVVFEKGLDRAVLAVHQAPEAAQPALRERLRLLAERALALIEGLDAAQNEESATAVTALQEKLDFLIIALNESDGEEIAQVTEMASELTAVPTPTPQPETDDDRPAIGKLDDTLAVPFPEGSVDHAFFPLTGGHDLQCSNCHNGGNYKGASPVCIDCHVDDEPHEGQFGPNCASCHTIESWTAVTFDHSLVQNQDCAACHAPPPNHYQGACSACHSDTTNFKNAVFNHAAIGSQDCAACHSPPANHYQGACSACHSDTTNFKNAVFNHATIGSQDCAACHSPPPNHYQGACRDCHTDTGNFKNAVFNHSTIGGQDCAACHAPPPNHYQGACRDCHTDTGNFKNAVFNHSTIGGQDCSACHSPPPNHYQGACRDCHTDTGNFKNARFNHSTIGNQDCAACHSPPANHYQGACRDCHTDTGNFRNARFNHSTIGNQDCAACHSPPANHYQGACRDCHTDTGNFNNAAFNHATIGGQDCSACHSPPPNHYQGACRDCHNDTTNFRNATFDHTFPTDHKDANGDCAKCHPGGNTSTYTCTACHEQNKMDDKHKEESGYQGDNCVQCHADGRKHDD